MAVITISRQMGSLGGEVARLVANRLGYRLIWHELINQAAIQAGAPEMALAVIDELGLFGINPTVNACYAYIRAVQKIVEELAKVGNVVIVGRAGQMILAGWESVLHVRLIAPMETRTIRVAQEQHISMSAAQAQVLASDHTRQSYLKRFYHVEWNDPNLYDLVINTGKIPLADATDLICATLEKRSNIQIASSSS
jgi:CMP/dCMP kinase